MRVWGTTQRRKRDRYSFFTQLILAQHCAPRSNFLTRLYLHSIMRTEIIPYLVYTYLHNIIRPEIIPYLAYTYLHSIIRPEIIPYLAYIYLYSIMHPGFIPYLAYTYTASCAQDSFCSICSRLASSPTSSSSTPLVFSIGPPSI